MKTNSYSGRATNFSGGSISRTLLIILLHAGVVSARDFFAELVRPMNTYQDHKGNTLFKQNMICEFRQTLVPVRVNVPNEFDEPMPRPPPQKNTNDFRLAKVVQVGPREIITPDGGTRTAVRVITIRYFNKRNELGVDEWDAPTTGEDGTYFEPEWRMSLRDIVAGNTDCMGVKRKNKTKKYSQDVFDDKIIHKQGTAVGGFWHPRYNEDEIQNMIRDMGRVDDNYKEYALHMTLDAVKSVYDRTATKKTMDSLSRSLRREMRNKFAEFYVEVELKRASGDEADEFPNKPVVRRHVAEIVRDVETALTDIKATLTDGDVAERIKQNIMEAGDNATAELTTKITGFLGTAKGTIIDAANSAKSEMVQVEQATRIAKSQMERAANSMTETSRTIATASGQFDEASRKLGASTVLLTDAVTTTNDLKTQIDAIVTKLRDETKSRLDELKEVLPKVAQEMEKISANITILETASTNASEAADKLSNVTDNNSASKIDKMETEQASMKIILWCLVGMNGFLLFLLLVGAACVAMKRPDQAQKDEMKKQHMRKVRQREMMRARQNNNDEYDEEAPPKRRQEAPERRQPPQQKPKQKKKSKKKKGDREKKERRDHK